MLFIFFLFTVVAGSLSVWLYVRSKLLHPLEKLSVWVFSAAFVKLTFTLSVLNLGWLKISGSVWDTLTYDLAGYSFISVLIAYTAGVCVSRRAHAVWKIWLVPLCGVVLAFIEYTLDLSRLLVFVRWDIGMSMARYFLLIGMTVGFAFLFRKLLIKKGILNGTLSAEIVRRQ